MQSLDLKRFEAKPGESLPELLRKFNDKLHFRKNKRAGIDRAGHLAR
jgi:hypothetical protein